MQFHWAITLAHVLCVTVPHPCRPTPISNNYTRTLAFSCIRSPFNSTGSSHRLLKPSPHPPPGTNLPLSSPHRGNRKFDMMDAHYVIVVSSYFFTAYYNKKESAHSLSSLTKCDCWNQRLKFSFALFFDRIWHGKAWWPMAWKQTFHACTSLPVGKRFTFVNKNHYLNWYVTFIHACGFAFYMLCLCFKLNVQMGLCQMPS